MRQRSTERLTMYRSVYSYIQEHENAWSGLPKFVEAVEKLNELLNRLQENMSFQANVTLGKSKVKESFIEELQDLTAIAKRALRIYAKDQNDLLLAQKHSESKSAVFRATNFKLELMAKAVAEDLQSLATALEPYGLATSWQATYIQKVNNLAAVNISTRGAINERKFATSTILDLDKTINDLLRTELDTYMEFFKESARDFFSNYKNVRRIIHQKHRGIKPIDRDSES